MRTEPRGALMAEMQSEPLEPEPDSTGVGMVELLYLFWCNINRSKL